MKNKNPMDKNLLTISILLGVCLFGFLIFYFYWKFVEPLIIDH